MHIRSFTYEPKFTVETGTFILAAISKRHAFPTGTESKYKPHGVSVVTLSEDAACDLFDFVARSLDIAEEGSPAPWALRFRDDLLAILHDLNVQFECVAIDRDMLANAY